MGPRKYPPLTPREIIEILGARGFTHHHNHGDHQFFIIWIKGKKRISQVDMRRAQYSEYFLKLLIQETGMSREDFYRSTKSTAKKVNLCCASAEELNTWAAAYRSDPVAE